MAEERKILDRRKIERRKLKRGVNVRHDDTNYVPKRIRRYLIEKELNHG